MPYTFRWDEEAQVVEIHYTGTITVEEVSASSQELLRFLQSRPSRTNMLIYFDKSVKFPLNPRHITGGSSSPTFREGGTDRSRQLNPIIHDRSTPDDEYSPGVRRYPN